ncbi:hypothetical protein PSQ19_05985 [Devosia algicola]|uniref:Uncharacterized protein n=1 Tax=Devosia algicola TaxID=3026418 RepID=A0ABY7YR11_9HYPH|nr:hypothetical protein [Devosia algicola]WDR03617.1 hypothetical protein PSQ19_05985 [Devosia algicola]
MFSTVAGRTAIGKMLMAKNIGSAPTAVAGFQPGGSQVMAVTGQGSSPMTLMRSASSPSRSFDADVHAGQNMDVYRANRAATGGPITQSSINSALGSGKTLYKRA